jgi:dTMP kinase
MTIKQGKFIVIDGADGSGKATQTQLIAKRLRTQGFSVEIADFPQYGQKSAGMVEEYLNGRYGQVNDVGPYRASLFYAIDRYDASFKINEWLNEGKIVIANRYTSSNMAHQGAKIKNSLERKAYFQWISNLEFDLLKIPKPDLTLILHVDSDISQKLIEQKTTRKYIENGETKDIHEKDINHLMEAEKIYSDIAVTFPNYKLIECSPKKELLSIESINDLIFKDIVLITGDNTNFKKNERQLIVERLSPTAKLPSKAYEGDAGFDLYADDYYTIYPGERVIIKTGLKIQLPQGHVGLIKDRSSLASMGMHCTGGVIDSGYRGEWLINIINLSQDIFNISIGQKIAQFLVVQVENPFIHEAIVNNNSERLDGSFGSSGMF